MLDVTDDDPRAVPVYATAGKRGAGCVFGARLWRGGKIGGGETETQKVTAGPPPVPRTRGKYSIRA